MENQGSRVSTGVPGLDHVLTGGLPRNHVYLVRGDPGAGKTTLSLQFLLEGRRRGERGLYVALGETKEELDEIAVSHGWNLEGIDIFELNDGPQAGAATNYTLFHPSEVELGETTRRVMEAFDTVKPSRLVFDSLSEMRLLARDPLRYRRQILGLKRFFLGRQCVVLLLDDGSTEVGELQLQSITHGVLQLDNMSPEYGGERRRLRVVKLRGVSARGGFHDFTIQRGGLVVHPRLVASEYRETGTHELVSSDVKGLDDLCGGGLNRGSSTLILGPAGAGKSTVALQFVIAAADRGERATIFAFDEGVSTLAKRAAGLGMPLAELLRSERVRVIPIDPAELTPGQFSNLVQREVVAGARLIVIDSLNGYLNAMPEERFLVIQMHELLSYLGQQGVVTIMTLAQHGLVGEQVATPVDLSYLADGTLLLRYFEAGGEVHKAINMIKKRHGPHEKAIRELRMGPGGVHVGAPLRAFRGVLTGVPVYDSTQTPLVPERDGAAT
jgi:circadian clock protein KaiC